MAKIWKTTLPVLLILSVFSFILSIPAHYAQQTQSRYGCIPKGVTLEGAAAGIPELKEVTFDKTGNRFILNGNVLYNSPLPNDQMVLILRAVYKDDRLGVSYNITNDNSVVFGALSSRGKVTDALTRTDLLLAAVIFGWDQYLKDVTLPNEYVPQKVPSGTNTVGFFVFDKYLFAVKENQLVNVSSTVTPHIFPVVSTTVKTAGFKLDEDALKRDDYLTQEHQANLREIYANLAAYKALEPVAMTIKVGEAASFARYLRDSKIELKPLLKQM